MFQIGIFRFVLQHLPGKIKTKEIEEMIKTVDKNRDGKISYSEFRVRGNLIFFLLTIVDVKFLSGDAWGYSTGHPWEPTEASTC